MSKKNNKSKFKHRVSKVSRVDKKKALGKLISDIGVLKGYLSVFSDGFRSEINKTVNNEIKTNVNKEVLETDFGSKMFDNIKKIGSIEKRAEIALDPEKQVSLEEGLKGYLIYKENFTKLGMKVVKIDVYEKMISDKRRSGLRIVGNDDE